VAASTSRCAGSFTCDWFALAIPLDEAYVRAIRTVFKALFDEGLIYGASHCELVPHDLSAISDEESSGSRHHDHPHPPALPGGGRREVGGDVRPETMLGDTAVAVNPTTPLPGPGGP